MNTNKTPINLYLNDSNEQFNPTKALVGAAVGTIFLGGWGALLGAALGGNHNKYTFTIVFDDDSREDFSYLDKSSFLAQLLIWKWRITNKATVKDFVTFDLQFSNFNNISNATIAKNVGLDEIPSIDAKTRKATVRKLSEFLVKEITRFINAQPRPTRRNRRAASSPALPGHVLQWAEATSAPRTQESVGVVECGALPKTIRKTPNIDSSGNITFASDLEILVAVGILIALFIGGFSIYNAVTSSRESKAVEYAAQSALLLF